MLSRLAGDALRALIAVSLGGAVLLSDTVALHAQGGLPTFKTARAFRCNYSKGAQTTWYEEAAVDEPAVSVSHWDTYLTYYAIDRKKGRAQMMGNQGKATVLLVSQPEGLNFVEITDSGNMIFTTIFSSTDDLGYFKAVMSRHLAFPGGPLVSQWFARCSPIEM